MSALEKKTRKEKKEPSPTLTSLPDDLLLSCLARVSRLYYPSLSLVSKRFRSLFASPELYKVRSLLGHTENCLYVCIDFLGKSRWFTLCRKPDTKTLTESSGYVLAKVPIPDSRPVNVLMAVGSNIYNIGGSETGSRSSSVLILDCKSHTWRKAPSFPVELWSFSASVFDRKIYVAGSYNDKYGFLKKTFQVLDTKTLIWDPMPFPLSAKDHMYYIKSAFIEGKFHVTTGRGGEMIAYDFKEGRWDMVGREMGRYMDSEDSYCVIENVLYSASRYGEFRWYDTDVKEWRNLKGLVGLPQFPPMACVRLTDYGGKMAVLWDEDYSFDDKKIWLAEIVLEKCRESYEIWGNVEWCDRVLTISNSRYHVIKVLDATV